MTEQLLLGRANGQLVYIEPFHTLFAGQTNLSGKTTTIIALAGEAVKKGFTVLLFDTKPTSREFEGFHEIPVCYQPTTDPLVLIGLLEAKRKAKLSPLYATLGRICERAKDVKDIIRNAEAMEEKTKSGFIKDACYTLADLLKRIDAELSSVKFSDRLELQDGTINVIAINSLSNEAQQLVLKTAFQQLLRNHFKKTIVVVDEAFKFFPENYGSACKREGQELITQGAKTGLFMWISTQFIAPTDKDPMKACPNKLFGRQDDSTEIEAIQKRIPGGKALKAEQLMTLKRGEFYFVPLDGKPKKVLVTPPWEREQPKKDPIAEMELLRQEVASLKGQLRDAGQAIANWPEKRREAPVSNGPVSAQSPPDIAIEHADTIVQIKHKEPRLEPMSTSTAGGRVLYVIVNDHKGSATQDQIVEAELEYGWTTTRDAVRMVLQGKHGLLDKGYLVRDGDKFRTPGKVRIEVVKD